MDGAHALPKFRPDAYKNLKYIRIWSQLMQIISVICGELIMIHVTMFRWSSGAWSDWNKQSCPRRCHRRPSTLYRRTSQWQDWVSSRRPPVYLHMDQNPQDSAWAGLPGTTAIVFGWSAWWLHAGGNDMQPTDISDQRTINICVHAMKVSTHVLWSRAGKPKSRTDQRRPLVTGHRVACTAVPW
jgi:hypothetical protein